MFRPRTFSSAPGLAGTSATSALVLLTFGLLACSSPRNDVTDDKRDAGPAGGSASAAGGNPGAGGSVAVAPAGTGGGDAGGGAGGEHPSDARDQAPPSPSDGGAAPPSADAGPRSLAPFQAVWASPGAETVTLAVTGEDIYAGGNLWGRADFGPGTAVSSLGDVDIIVARFRADGSFRWSKVFATSGHDTLDNLVVAPDGDIVITGTYEGTMLSVGSVSVSGPNTTGSNNFLARLSPDGQTRWAKNWDRGTQMFFSQAGLLVVLNHSIGGLFTSVDAAGVPIKDLGPPVALDQPRLRNAGVVTFACGHFVGTLAVATVAGPKTFTARDNSRDVILLKADPNGQVLWAVPLASSATDVCTDLVIDKDSNVILAGDFPGAIDWGSVAPGTKGGVTLVSIDGNDGHQRWTTVLPKGRPGSLTLDRNGDVVLMQWLGGQIVDFGGDSFAASSAFGRFSSATGKYLSGSGYAHGFASVARHTSGDLIVGFSDQLLRLALP
jgi:hypothetical protein